MMMGFLFPCTVQIHTTESRGHSTALASGVSSTQRQQQPISGSKWSPPVHMDMGFSAVCCREISVGPTGQQHPSSPNSPPRPPRRILNDHRPHIKYFIPTEIGTLTRLTYLAMAENRLSHPLPTELGNLHRLRDLYAPVFLPPPLRRRPPPFHSAVGLTASSHRRHRTRTHRGLRRASCRTLEPPRRRNAVGGCKKRSAPAVCKATS